MNSNFHFSFKLFRVLAIPSIILYLFVFTAGAIVDIEDEELRTPLHMAVFYTEDENAHIVELLLANGANPIKNDRFGKTPISRAEENDFLESLKLLQVQ